MIDTSTWQYFYKLAYTDGLRTETNLIYTPLVNLEGTIMCMKFDEHSPYLEENKGISKTIVDFFFEREVKYLTKFQSYPWAPKIIDIDLINRCIYIEFNTNTLNHLIMTNHLLDDECPDWKDQIFTILQDFNQAGFYKMALYPHCFYLGDDNKIKTFDFYSCVDKEDSLIERDKIEGIIGKESTERFDNSTVDGMIDFNIFFKITVLNHLSKTWFDNPFPEFYKRLEND